MFIGCICFSRHFVPNFTFGPTVVKSLRKNISKGFFDCHLMVTEPQKWMKEFAAAGANQFTYHYEVDGMEEVISNYCCMILSKKFCDLSS